MRKLMAMGVMTLITLGAAAQIETGVFRTPSGNTDYHQFTRTGGGGAAVYINQTDTLNAILRLSHRTASANVGVVFTVENNGNTGIGTLTPDSRLTVAGGGISLFSGLSNSQPRPDISAGTIPGEIRGMSATSPNLDDGFLRLSAGGRSSVSTKSYIDLSGYARGAAADRLENITMGTKGIERLRITSAGYIGIGTIDPKQKLSVHGNIQAQEIIVTGSDWPDYVFDSSYQLPSLEEVAAQIDKEGHLAGIPAAEEVEANGQRLGALNKALLQKVEELTLYLIRQQKNEAEQDKKMKALEESNQLLQKQMGQLKEQLPNLPQTISQCPE